MTKSKFGRSVEIRHVRIVVPILFALFAGLIHLPAAIGQGLLVDTRSGYRTRLPRPEVIIPRPSPNPPGSYKIASLDVNVKLVDQVARVQVSQTFVNTGSRQMEAAFVFPLPYDGAVDRLTLMVDGKEYEARLLPAADARRLYESIVRKNQDPALLEWIGAGLFKTSVFPLPPGAKRTVTLRYSQICRASNGLTDFLFPLSTAKYTSSPLENQSFRVAIESTAPIKNVYSPSHEITIDRPAGNRVIVSYSKTNVLPAADFRLLYDIGKEQIGSSVISFRPDPNKDGYFVLLASPSIPSVSSERPKKNVLFVVDRSGSMSGEKMEQVKSALKFVLNHLREGDLFNIIAYDNEVEAFRPEMQRFDSSSRSAALGFVGGIYAGGSTNIEGALRRAMEMLTDSSRPNYLIFLTDGLPTAGETSEARISALVAAANRVRARLFTFGVGYDVNSRLLDRLARKNYGQSEFVRPNEDIESSVAALYRRIKAPALTDVSIQVDVERAHAETGPPINRVYPNHSIDLFAGEQHVVVGRYKTGGAAKISIRGYIDGAEKKFSFPARLDLESKDATNAFVARLWATRRIGEIIDQIDLQGQNDELVQELVSLATEHGILTRYTSFLADETSDLHDLTKNLRRAADLTGETLSQADGAAGFGGRAEKGALQRAARAPAATAPGVPSGPTAGHAGKKTGRSGGRAAGLDKHVQSVGKKTFFYRGGRWVDSTLTRMEEENARKIDRFSGEYFKLADQFGKDVGKYQSLDGSVIVKLGNEVVTW